MPSVNTFGGCDPFIEIRCVKGEPKDDGKVIPFPKNMCRTKAKDNDLNPVWNETIELANASYGPDHWIQVILWDSNITKNTPIGYKAISSQEALKGLQYNPKGPPVMKDMVVDNFHNILAGKTADITSIVSLKWGFYELHKYTIVIKKASRLPRVDTLGSIDPFIDVRLVSGDPLKADFSVTPGNESKWSGKTKQLDNNMDPIWNETLSFVMAGNPSWSLVVTAFDAGNLSNTPVGFAVIPWKQICQNKGGVAQDFKEKLKKIPNFDAPDGLKVASVSFSIQHDLAMAD